jgi:uncharacterized protein (DUF433 family)
VRKRTDGALAKTDHATARTDGVRLKTGHASHRTHAAKNKTCRAGTWPLDHATADEKLSIMHTPAMELPEEFVWCDPERLGGKPCFRGTRVPVDALFGNLEDGMSLEEFLDAFEGVTREQAGGVLEAARAAVHGVMTA